MRRFYQYHRFPSRFLPVSKRDGFEFDIYRVNILRFGVDFEFIVGWRRIDGALSVGQKSGKTRGNGRPGAKRQLSGGDSGV